jgi:hypothetical protein
MGDSLRVQSIVLAVLFVAVVGVGVLLTSFYRETSRTTTFVIPPDITACEADGDCGLIDQISCCPCDAGGGQGAVNKSMRGRLKGFLRRACGHKATCVNVLACRTDLRAACTDGTCTVTPAGDAARARRDPGPPR